MGLKSLRVRRDKLKWWYKLPSMPEDRYPKQLLVGSGKLRLLEVDKGKYGVVWLALGLDKYE